MTWPWLVLGLGVVAALAALLYWLFVIAEGTYLGPRVVAWTYDLVAGRYDAIKQFKPRDESWFVAGPLLQGLVGIERPLVLDVATGTGRLPLALFRNRFRGHVVGLDLSLGMLRQARSRLTAFGEQVSLVWQDASHLPFDDGAFDAVASLESLEFMARPLEVLSEMVRVLAPGGVLMVTNRVGTEARLLPSRAVSRPAFRKALVDHGLDPVEVQIWQVNYDLALARKPGAPRAGRGEGAEPAALIRCPQCGRKLVRGSGGLSCPGCGQVHEIREGIVYLASAKKPG
jgi:ubiquinone/menaquinone biosynthesis C-methylase UbiE